MNEAGGDSGRVGVGWVGEGTEEEGGVMGGGEVVGREEGQEFGGEGGWRGWRGGRAVGGRREG